MEYFYGKKDQRILDSDPKDTVRGIMERGEKCDYPIKVYVFKKMNPFEDIEGFAKTLIESILEQLDEEYGDPDSFGTEPTEKMKESSLSFAKVLKKEYYTWSCETTGDVIEFSEVQAKKIASL